MKVLSYNILADSYLLPERYQHISVMDYTWEKRKKTLFAQITSFDADVICLQELETIPFNDLNIKLQTLGYRGLFIRKGFGKPDGLGIFFRYEAFPFAGAKSITYNDGFQGGKPSGHIAHIVYLHAEEEIWAVVTTHIKPHFIGAPPDQHIGYRQVFELIHDHIHHNQKAQQTIICGDFNSEEDGIVHDLITKEGFSDAFANKIAPTYKDRRIDFIFHSNGLISSPTPLPAINDPMPNKQYPSDHLPICSLISSK